MTSPTDGVRMLRLADIPRDAAGDGALPIVVDLDRTLVTVDVFHTQLTQLLLRRPWLVIWAAAVIMRSGVPTLKARVAERTGVDTAQYRLNPGVVAVIEQAEDRRVELSTGAAEVVAAAFAATVPGITDVSSSRPGHNLTGRAKAAHLVEKYGERGFYYIGDSHKDIAVGARAAGLVLVDRNGDREPRPGRRLRRLLGDLVREIRVKHWLKNLLVFVPLVGSQELLARPDAAAATLAIFFALSFVASSTYVVNDLIDYPNDAVNRLKSHRPLVSGAVPFPVAIVAAALLFVAGFGLSAWVGWRGVLACVVYLVVTLAYMYVFKRRMVLDVLALAGLYVLRILIGAVVAEVALTSWLLLFALFFFFSLACVKRYTEIVTRQEDGHAGVPGRSYRAGDGLAMAILGVASGFAAILLYSLYIATEAVRALYPQPEVLILGLPVLLYWVSHLWMHGLRREVDADPVDWAARDPRSLIAGAVFVVVVVAAAVPWPIGLPSVWVAG